MSTEIKRCSWATNDLLIAYHDEEYGRLVHEESAIFEKICLESFSAGLSWYIVLKKRPALRDAFADFDVDACASLSDGQLEQAMARPDIIRNRRKVEAVRTNAQVIRSLRSEGGILSLILRQKRPVDLAADLKKRGLRQFGPVCAGELMKSLGLLPAHEPSCALARREREEA